MHPLIPLGLVTFPQKTTPLAKLNGAVMSQKKEAYDQKAPYYGLEFSWTALDAWAGQHGMRRHFIQPGKPVQNVFRVY